MLDARCLIVSCPVGAKTKLRRSDLTKGATNDRRGRRIHSRVTTRQIRRLGYPADDSNTWKAGLVREREGLAETEVKKGPAYVGPLFFSFAFKVAG